MRNRRDINTFKLTSRCCKEYRLRGLHSRRGRKQMFGLKGSEQNVYRKIGKVYDNIISIIFFSKDK